MVDQVIKWGGIIATLIVFGWCAYYFKKLGEKEKDIFKLTDEIDNIEQDKKSKIILQSGYVNQSQFERMTEKRRKPMIQKLERLKLERQFILDRIPLLGYFKK